MVNDHFSSVRQIEIYSKQFSAAYSQLATKVMSNSSFLARSELRLKQQKANRTNDYKTKFIE